MSHAGPWEGSSDRDIGSPLSFDDDSQALNDSAVLDEDSSYEPGEEEVKEYAQFLGMDVDRHADLLWIAREGLKAPLPAPWKPCKTKETPPRMYYFNFETGESSWEYPCDKQYKDMFLHELAKREKRGNNGEREEAETREAGEEEEEEEGGGVAIKLFSSSSSSSSSSSTTLSPTSSISETNSPQAHVVSLHTNANTNKNPHINTHTPILNEKTKEQSSGNISSCSSGKAERETLSNEKIKSNNHSNILNVNVNERGLNEKSQQQQQQQQQQDQRWQSDQNTAAVELAVEIARLGELLSNEEARCARMASELSISKALAANLKEKLDASVRSETDAKTQMAAAIREKDAALAELAQLRQKVKLDNESKLATTKTDKGDKTGGEGGAEQAEFRQRLEIHDQEWNEKLAAVKDMVKQLKGCLDNSGTLAQQLQSKLTER